MKESNKLILTALLISGFVYLGHKLQLQVYKQEEVRYHNCLKTGRDKKICSIASVFSPHRFNEDNPNE